MLSRNVMEVAPGTGQKFKYVLVVSIGDTNMEGNVYWTNYFEWFGKAREAFLISVFPEFLKMFSSGARLLTHETNIRHISSAFFTEEIVLEISVGEMRKTSAKVLVDFIKKSTGEKIAEGWQTIVFANAEGRPAPIPSELREAVLKYAIPSGKME